MILSYKLNLIKKFDSMSEESGERIIPVSIEDEMKTAYIDYSMSVYFKSFTRCKRWFKTCSQKSIIWDARTWCQIK